MPELAEVETVRRSVARALVGRWIERVTVRRRDVVVTELDPPGGFSRARSGAVATPKRVPGAMLLAGDRVSGVVRHGKQLAIVGDTGRVVCVHLGMSGRLLVAGAGERLARASWGEAHDHVVWRMEGGGRLVFRDPRRFGGVWLSPSVEHLRRVRWAGLGVDALEVTGALLRERAGGSARAVKAVLLDQNVLAGVGNIYADEALFRAGVSPTTPARGLGASAWGRIASSVRAVLGEAIEAGGSSLRDYTDSDGTPGGFAQEHRVYGRGGEACVVCGGILEASTLAQRTTVWCPVCQPASQGG